MHVLGWTVDRAAEDLRVCTPPAGRAAGWAEVRDRVRPLVPMRELVARRRETLASEGIDVAVTPRAHRRTTAEGELAAMVTLEGTHRGAPIQHTLGVVYADDFMLTVDARAMAPDHRERVLAVAIELVHNAPLGLGELRARRYLYQPPADWQGVARGLVTDWYPSELPRSAAWIKVLPARPLRLAPAIAQIQSLLHDDSFASFQPEGQLVRDDADFGSFTCIVARALGRFTDGRRDDSRRMLITAGLTDSRFLYALRLDSGELNATAHERVFLEVVRSCLALPTAQAAPVATALAHWIE